MLPTDRDESFHVLEYHQRYRNEELIKYMPYRSGLRALACGQAMGVLVDQLAGRTAVALGVDGVPPAETAWVPPGQVALGSLQAMPLPALSFDVAIGEHVLSTARDPARVVRDVGRVLRPGGSLILCEARRWFEDRELLARRWLRAAGLALRVKEHYDYLAYPAALVMSRLPGLAYAQVTQALAKAAFAVDGLLGRWAWLYRHSWHLIVVASKGDGTDG